MFWTFFSECSLIGYCSASTYRQFANNAHICSTFFVPILIIFFDSRPPLIKLPVSMVWRIIIFVKWMHRKWGFPKLNHLVFRYIQLALHSRTFNCLEAQKNIGYTPVVSLKVSIVHAIRDLLSFVMSIVTVSFGSFLGFIFLQLNFLWLANCWTCRKVLH